MSNMDEQEHVDADRPLDVDQPLDFRQGAQLLATVGVFERMLAFLAWSKEDSSVSADE